MDMSILRRRIHVSWLIAIFCAGIVAGVIAAQHILLSGYIWLWVGLAFFALGLWRQKVYALGFLIVAVEV
jgi:hypothetical protein